MARSRRRTALTGARCARIALAAALLSGCYAAAAGDVEVLAAELRLQGDDTWHVSVTLRHDDTGWEHYADAWRVVGPDRSELGTRILHHPHETEQPFTRSLGGVRIPAGIGSVRLRARDSVHGFGGAEFELELPGR